MSFFFLFDLFPVFQKLFSYLCSREKQAQDETVQNDL